MPRLHFSQGKPLSLLCSPNTSTTLDLSVSRSDLHHIVQIFCQCVYHLNSEISVSSEYFILRGDRCHSEKKPQTTQNIEIHVHQAILHRITHFLLRCVHKTILDISGSSEYLFWEGDSLSQFNEGPAPPTTKKHHSIIETAPLMGTKGSMISQLLHKFFYSWTHESGL